jgi:hypothetical protein
MIISVVCLLLWSIFAGGAFSAEKKSRDVNWSRPITELAPAQETGLPPAAPYQYPTGGQQYRLSCTDILPDVGTIIQHDQIGDTWYDFQKNGSMGRMISVTNSGYRHFSWMYINQPYASGVTRYVKANCKNPAGGWLGVTDVEGSATTTPGYCNQTHLLDGKSVVIYHKSNPPSPSYFWATTLSKDTLVCGGYFTKHWDLPDYIANSASGSPGMWPKAEVSYGDSSGIAYIHVVMTEANTAGGMPVMVAYERCYFGTNDSVICQAFQGGSTKRYAIKNDVQGPGSFAPISHFDSSCSITPVVVVSPAGNRVAITFLKPADPAATCNYGSDVCYIESMHNGDDWIAGTPWPPPEYHITTFGTTGNERAYNDVNACYDFQDSLHVVYVTAGFDPSNPGYWQPQNARLYHWSKKDGSSMITSAVWDAASGGHNANIAKMSISAKDPIYHPGGDSVYLFAIWTQFDTSDLSADNYTNGEIYGCGTFNGGATWGALFNLTGTKTPGCAPGTCVSEHWSSMAQNMYNGDLHIQYICDREPGCALSGQDAGSVWQDNPVMYLHLGEWPVTAVPRGAHKLIQPEGWPDWYHPPLKVAPNGSRVIQFREYSIGNANLIYDVSSSNPTCIQVSVSPTVLFPRDSASVDVTIIGSGACNNTIIDGDVQIHTNEDGGKTEYIHVQAIVADDYYECPKDPVTHDSLDNGVLAGWFCVNSMERIWDVSAVASADTFSTFFQGGTIVATTRLGDTLVGRYMGGNDQNNGAQDIMHKIDDATRDYWILYTSRVFMHDFEPPMDIKWYWWEINYKIIIFFKPTAPDALKHTVIKYIIVCRKPEPIWYPEHPTFTGYDNTYIGMAMDIDCPYDTMLSESGRNRAGYDATNNIAWQKGYGVEPAHLPYNNYYAGMALAQGRQPGESTVPYSTHNVKNNQYLYPTPPWGWIDQELYNLAADPTVGYVQDGPSSTDSVVDRSQVFTARKIVAGTDSTTRAAFTIIEAIAPAATKGLAELQINIAAARAWVAAHQLLICGDVNSSGQCELGDVVYLISYLYKSGMPPAAPLARADVNSSGQVELGDVVFLISYLYKNGLPPMCAGLW